MPHSDPEFDPLLEELINLFAPSNLLDLGAGSGKYGRIAKSLNPATRCIAVELHSPYISRYKLVDLYDEVREMNAVDLIHPDYFSEKYDLVVAGDLIEHLRKSDGLDLINFFLYRSAWILLVYPLKYLQDIVRGNPHEAHISAWCDADFSNLDETTVLRRRDMELVCIRGYLPTKISLSEVERLLGGGP